MEIYQAINEANENIDLACSNPWKVQSLADGTYIVKRTATHSLRTYYLSYDPEYYYFIELKRGGLRIFKTLDAACNAVREIGQGKCEVIL